MLFTNTTLFKIEKEQSFGTLYQFKTVQDDNFSLAITTKPNITEIQKGLQWGLSIGKTNSGRPKIINNPSKEVYLVLTTRANVEEQVEDYIQISGEIFINKDKFDDSDIEVLDVCTILQNDKKVSITEVALMVRERTMVTIRKGFSNGKKIYFNYENLIINPDDKVAPVISSYRLSGTSEPSESSLLRVERWKNTTEV